MHNIFRIYLLALVFILSSSVAHAQRRGGRAGKYRPATPTVQSLNQLNKQRGYLNRSESKRSHVRQSRYSVYESVIGSTRTRTTNSARRIINEFKNKFGLKKIDSKLQTALSKTLSINKEALDTMKVLRDKSSAISTRAKQMTPEEYVLRTKIVEAIALSGQYKIGSFLKEAAGTFGTVDAKVVGFQSRILTEAINRMRIVSPQTRHFYHVLNEVTVRNGVGKKVGNRRQCI